MGLNSGEDTARHTPENDAWPPCGLYQEVTLPSESSSRRLRSEHALHEGCYHVPDFGLDYDEAASHGIVLASWEWLPHRRQPVFHLVREARLHLKLRFVPENTSFSLRQAAPRFARNTSGVRGGGSPMALRSASVAPGSVFDALGGRSFCSHPSTAGK